MYYIIIKLNSQWHSSPLRGPRPAMPTHTFVIMGFGVQCSICLSQMVSLTWGLQCLVPQASLVLILLTHLRDERPHPAQGSNLGPVASEPNALHIIPLGLVIKLTYLLYVKYSLSYVNKYI